MYEATNGGFVRVQNKENNVSSTHYYNGATETHRLSMSIDLENPYHCTGTITCVNKMLTTPNLINTSTINLRWSDWKDDDAGIDHFLIEVHELHAVGSELGDKSRVLTKTVPCSTTTDSVTLKVGIYSVILSAYDKADNHKSTRRILIYDGKSSVSTRSNTKLQVTTASTAASQWQTASSSPVSVDWTDRYTNTLHHNNNWLLGIASVDDLDSLYDDNEGDRTVDRINNTNGITRITTAYKIDHNGGSSIESTPNDTEFTNQGLSQSQTISPSLVDGDSLRFWVRAYDVMSNYKEENVSVHIDTTPPIIDNLWLTRGDRLNISVHRIEDLNEMTMEWIAYDVHSGLETVSWRVVDKFDGKNIVHGIENIRAQGETSDMEQCMKKYAAAARGANCYCTPVMGCYHRHFQVKPMIVDSSLSHGGIFSDKYKGVHDSDYHLEVTVTNHAKLTTKLQFKITIDASPPHPGIVHDGSIGHPEIDYQDSLQLQAHWDGFFDRESGVKFYQYTFGPQCLKSSDFGLDDPSLKVNETYSTSTSWTAPSVGKYHVTAVAYNRALEPSDPVCSDGITVDTTPPSLSEVSVAASRVVEGLVKTSDGSVWVIDSERRRSQISEPNSECMEKASSIDDKALSLFPQHRFKDKTVDGKNNVDCSEYTSFPTTFINTLYLYKENAVSFSLFPQHRFKDKTVDGKNNVDCSEYTSFPTTFINTLYLYKENALMVNWTGSDSESGIYDYELGLMSDPSGEAAPDILSYTSTHHHPQYQGYHPGLSEGQQFYIGVKATNKAGISVTKVLGPMKVHTMSPVFTGTITVSLAGDFLIAQWTKGSFTDPESAYLTYQVAVGTREKGTITLPFGALKSGGTCTLTSPATCTAVAIRDLHWDLHHSYTYFVSVRVTNIVGLSAVGMSEPYVHDVRLPSRGVVLDICPEGEESLFAISNYEDTDNQISTISLRARWYGFDNGLDSVTYEVGVGSEPLTSDIKEMVRVGNNETHEFTGLKLKESKDTENVWLLRVSVIADLQQNGSSVTVSHCVNNGRSSMTRSQTSSIQRVLPSLPFRYMLTVTSRNECSLFGARVTRSKYYVTVEGRTGAGNTTVSSDGVMIIKRDIDMSHVIIRDGPGCTTFNSDMANGHSEPECTRDSTYQVSSSTYAAHWRRSDTDRERYPDVFWSLQNKLPRSDDIWQTVRDYEHLGTSERILTGGVVLEPGYTYRAGVKFCAVRVCSLPTHSDGVTIIPHPPKAGSISLKYQETGDKSHIHVTMDKFRDPDILMKSESYDVMDRYEWSLSDDSSRLLEAWKDVDAASISRDEDKVSFTINLSKHLDFSKCRRLSVKGYNKVGMLTVASTDIKNCSAYDPAIVIPLLVIDAVGTSESWDLGNSISQDQNNAWGLPDADYTPYKNILSAVWPTLRHRNYTWAVVSGDKIDPISHYKRKNIMTVSDPCDIPSVVMCGTTDYKYMNVKFPPESYLQHGKRFYICIHADEMNIEFEKWTEQLDEVNACSDGITVDLTAPKAGTVTVEGLNVDNVQVSTTEVSLRWRGFTDVEEEGTISHSSGISHYEVALGSVPGGQDILKFNYVRLVDHITLHSLSLQSGVTVYASVRATDFVNKATTVGTGGFLVDSTPPVLTGRQLQIEDRYIISRLVHVCWIGVFVDEESELKTFLVAFGTKPGFDDISTYTYTDQTCKDIDTSNNIKESHSYYVTVKGYNKAGLYALVSSRPLVVSSTPPRSGHVYDGRKDASSADNKDENFVTGSSEMGAHWKGFQDPNSFVTLFKVKVGTCPGCDDKLEEFEYGTTKDIAFHHTSFVPGVKYYTTVTACSAAGLCSSSASDGIIIDRTAPVMGTIDDGTQDVDIQFQASRTFVGCKWRGSFDPESGLDHYEWRVGTTPGGDEILAAQSVALQEIAFHTLSRDGQLPVRQRLYITVRAYNKSGSYSEATSNGFTVDDSPPTVVTSPAFSPGFASSVSMTTICRTTLSVQWEFRDQESFIDRQYLSISSHELGEFNRSIHVVPSFTRQFVFSCLDLHDGSSYKVKVTACNMAGLCTSDFTQDILVDSSKPTTGTFAVETDHAARLSRHQFGGMTWTSNTLKLSWLGFSDLHSGIDHYIVTLGSQPFGTDLNKNGTQALLPHDTNGLDKGDEGIVQTATVPTKKVNEKDTVFVAIWAVNGVGLKSDPYHAQFTLDGNQTLWLVRRCQAYNCEGHCVCAVQDGTCHTTEGCVALNNGGPNNVVTVNDVIYLSFPSDVTDVDFSPLETVMAARWSVTTSQGMSVQRYEYSIGDCDETTPHGVFDVVNERLWFDAGQETSAILALPKDKHLAGGIKYCFFIRAWYDANHYSIFKSDGVTIDVSAPSFSTKSGFSVKECKDQSGSKDIDYQTSKATIFIDWTNKFLPGQSGILKYNVFISTTPGGHSIHESNDLTTTSYTVTGLSLEPDTVYYSNVLVYNKAGLVSWAYSDGVQVDIVPPVAGVVHDGQDIHDVDYQMSPTEVSSSWYGFSDSDSTIIKYYWCVGTVNDTTDCSIMDWQDTGLHRSFMKVLPSSLNSDTTLWSKVYAEDAVGHTSDIVVSDGVTIDTSPPEPQAVAYLGENLLRNPSFEEDSITEGTTNCNVVIPTSWETDKESCIKIVSPETPVAKHGKLFVSVSGKLQQTVTDLDTGRQYKLSIHTGYPQTVSTNHKPVEATVTIAGDAFTFSLDPNLCKGTCQVGEESVILWNTQTYRFTARNTTSVLKISSASRAMEFVLDHVSLQTVDYGFRSSSEDTENHLLVHSVCLSHWSSIHASWHFQDTESPIIQYKWAVGTVEGGTQILGYKNVGRNTQSTAVNLQLSHNSNVHISVVATNAAGLSTKSHSDPITVDMTPPTFDHIHHGPVWDDDLLTSSLVVVNWQVKDTESGIHYCDWAIGRTKGRSDVKKFDRVPSGESKAQHNINDVLTNNSITVYTTVRCFNGAGLVAAATTDGVTVLLESDVKHTPGVLSEGQSVYTQRGTCHQRRDRVRLHLHKPNLRLKSFVVGIVGENITYQNSITSKMEYTIAELAALKLTQRTSYEAISFPVDVLGTQGDTTAANFTVHGLPPTVSASGNVTMTREGTELTLSWETVFTTPWHDLLYEVQLGSVPGGADVVDRMLTKKDYVKLILNLTSNSVKDIFVSIAAVDPCGLSTFYSQKIEIDKSK